MTSAIKFLIKYVRPYPALFLYLSLIIVVAIAFKITAPILTGRFIDRALSGADVRSLIILAIAALLLTVSSHLLGLIEAIVAEQLSWNATNALRLNLAEHVLNLDYQFHTAITPGELIERVDGDVSQLAKFFSRLVVNVVTNLILMFAIVVVLLSTDWRIGTGVFLILTVAFVGAPIVRRRASPAFQAERQASAESYGYLSEYLEGLEDIRAGGEVARASVEHGFLMQLRNWREKTVRSQMWGYVLMSSTFGIFTLAVAFALGMGGYLVLNDLLTIGGLFAVIRLVELLREPMTRLRDEVHNLQQSIASLTRVQHLLAETPRIVDGPGADLPETPLSVEWRHVSFGYRESDFVLRNVSLRIEPGRILGIVGRTGSGKSTFARMVPRYLDPDVGQVLLGGHDLRTLKLADLRAQIGVVSQDATLLSASVRENLTMFAPIDPSADVALLETLHAFGLGDWLASLPNGLDTRIGPGGIGLSAGEAQLLCCARIALLDPGVVLLDEASARLDPVSERKLHDALARLLDGRTAIIIAHRLDTLAFADDIAVFDDGIIKEHGPRDTLSSNLESHFAALLQVDRQEQHG